MEEQWERGRVGSLRVAMARWLADLARINPGLSVMELAEALGTLQRELVKRHLRRLRQSRGAPAGSAGGPGTSPPRTVPS